MNVTIGENDEILKVYKHRPVQSSLNACHSAVLF